MKKLIILSCVVFTMFSCRNKDAKKADAHEVKSEMPQQTITALDLGCYVFTDGKNKVSLEITESGAEVKGNLSYAFAEKDKNTGTFIGQLKDGVLVANYTFQSEGLESVRQVAFQVQKDTLMEGYGDMNADGTTFKDVNRLTFSSDMPLVKTDCDEQKNACLYQDGKVYSVLEQNCLTLASFKTKLNPLKDGARVEGNPTYLIFNADNSKAEIFLPNFDKGIVLEKSSEGNWDSKQYKLFAWKGFVLQEKGVAIYGG